ncbi:DinB family protein [Microlunatus spumicola]|uniref:DinB family protein n=1 Tax=Microlunatus spumicola TaxID=81499 RepID=A0ABP6XD65_9ACTN
MSVRFPAPTQAADSRTEVYLRYLAYFRDGVIRRVGAMSEEEARRSRVPSGWSPLELVRHLTFMERRWFVWGFEGRAVDEPFGDAVDGRWAVPEGLGVADVLADFRRQAAATDAVVRRHDLDEVGRPSERWDGEPPATLERVLLHVLQEHARHLGHLDVVAELGGGVTGEA